MTRFAPPMTLKRSLNCLLLPSSPTSSSPDGRALPTAPSAKAEQQRLLKVSPDLVSYVDPQSVAAEGFRTLRSSILLSAVDHEPKLLLITSSFAAEGKSTSAANLAISFAQRSARVLLVDTDLRKGTLHMKFRLSNRAGLSTLLSRESGAEAYEHPLPELPNLTVLSRGPIAPEPWRDAGLSRHGRAAHAVAHGIRAHHSGLLADPCCCRYAEPRSAG